MTGNAHSTEAENPEVKRDRSPLSRLAHRMINHLPTERLSQYFVRFLLRRRGGEPHAQKATIERAAVISLQSTLQGIVEDVVTVLGYAGAMVATYEQGDTLPVRAIYVDPSITTQEEIQRWEKAISRIASYPVSITDPDIARVCVQRSEDAGNLSVRAVTGGGPVTSDSLYDLFTPVAPAASRPAVAGIQRALGIQQVIAVPFFLETLTDGQATRELVGNLFAAKRGKISDQDVVVLAAFGRQAAAAIGSERQRLQIEIMQGLIFRVQQSMSSEPKIFEWIVRGIVSDLGYVGAMVAPCDPDGALPVQALHVDPAIANAEQIQHWERAISEIAGRPVSLTDPAIARVYMNREEDEENLSVRATRAGYPVTSPDLYDLFRPVVPLEARGLVQDIQKALGIVQVIAVPFFLESSVDGGVTRELVGNLFAATRSTVFKPSEIALLHTFGQQAAAGIRNARLYRHAEEQRQTAQVFAKMAFSAATSVHALRNQLGTLQLYFEILRRLPPGPREQKLEDLPKIQENLDRAIGILETLREPWRQMTDSIISVNDCLQQALDELTMTKREPTCDIRLALSEHLPAIKAAPDMLTEAFRILMKNAFEALNTKGGRGELEITSARTADGAIAVTIRDTGVGIAPEDFGKVFEIGWSTKQSGMGFGLFWTRDYIEGLGGRITVSSVFGEGTTFSIYLPAPEAEVASS